MPKQEPQEPTEVAPSVAVEIVPAPPGLTEYLTGEAVPVAEAGEDAAIQIIQQVLDARTPEEVLAPIEAVHARDVLDQPMQLLGVRWLRSDYDVGTPFYAIMDVASIATGEKVAVTCGAQRVMAQLFRLAQLGAFPRNVILRQSTRPTSSGYYPLRLESVS